jgi:hypothetical protein
MVKVIPDENRARRTQWSGTYVFRWSAVYDRILTSHGDTAEVALGENRRARRTQSPEVHNRLIELERTPGLVRIILWEYEMRSMRAQASPHIIDVAWAVAFLFSNG